MSVSANGDNLKLGRGALFVRRYDASGDLLAYQEFIGNCTALELTSTNEPREKYSSTEQSSPLLDRRSIRQGYSFVAACDEHTKENLALFMSGTLSTRAQVLDSSGGPVVITGALAGKWYDLGYQGITNVVVTTGSVTHVSGTDYTVDSESGFLYVMPAGGAVGDTISVAFDVPARTYDVVRGGKSVSPNVKLIYIADDANTDGVGARDRVTVWKASVAPEGSYPFIGDDYSGFSLAFSVLSDAANHPDEPFFILERAQ